MAQKFRTERPSSSVISGPCGLVMIRSLFHSPEFRIADSSVVRWSLRCPYIAAGVLARTSVPGRRGGHGHCRPARAPADHPPRGGAVGPVSRRFRPAGAASGRLTRMLDCAEPVPSPTRRPGAGRALPHGRREFDRGLGLRNAARQDVLGCCTTRAGPRGARPRQHRLALHRPDRRAGAVATRPRSLHENHAGEVRRFTYRDLTVLSNGWADYLVKQGVKPRDRVCLFLDRVRSSTSRSSASSSPAPWSSRSSRPSAPTRC